MKTDEVQVLRLALKEANDRISELISKVDRHNKLIHEKADGSVIGPVISTLDQRVTELEREMECSSVRHERAWRKLSQLEHVPLGILARIRNFFKR